MKRWIKRGIGALTVCALLSAQVLAAEIALSFDKGGTTAAVQLRDVGSDRYAAEITLPLRNTQGVQFQGKADTYAVTIDAAAGTVTLYAASRTPLTVVDGGLDLGTLTVAAGTEISGVGSAVVLDRMLNRQTYASVELTVSHSDGGSTGSTGSTGGSSTGNTTTDRTPSVSVNGTGGKVQAASDGSVTITPDAGYRIARILVNGREVAVSTHLTGLSATDQVVVTFEKITSGLSFTDVRPTDWYAGAVTFAVERGLFQGTSATTFSPNVQMSRAMLVTVLYRLSGETAQGDSGFHDVSPDAWYGPAVTWARENGVVQGVSATQFAPNRPVTREQMATILYRYANAQATDGAAQTLAAFTDGSAVSGYAVPAMGWAVENGLLSGVGNRTLAPRGMATRAQVATILQRFLENVVE